MDSSQVLLVVGAYLAGILGMLGTVVGLYIHGSNQSHNQIAAIHAEIKDFHARLCEITTQRNGNKHGH